jgi:hypothetical protein
MWYPKRLAPALVAVPILALAIATSASALPDITVTLSGATYPLTMRLTGLSTPTKLTNVVKESFTGRGGLIYASLNELGHLGTYDVLFTNIENRSGTQCFSEENATKDSSGEVLTKGTWHLVYTSLSGSPQGLQLGVLALASPVEVVCGAEIIKVKGDLVASVETLAGTETEEYTKLSGVLLGNGEGKPNITVFYNEAGASVRTKLEANFGSGFKESDEEIGETTTSTASEGKMFTVTSR